jgi:hypothetical protein
MTQKPIGGTGWEDFFAILALIFIIIVLPFIDVGVCILLFGGWE